MAMDHDQIVRILLRDRDKLFAWIWSIVRDDHLAEDVYQDVCMLAIHKRDQIESEIVLPAWLRTTARHRALYAIRQSAARPVSLDAEVLEQLETAWARYDDREPAAMSAALRHCISTLSPAARELVEMRYQQSLKPAAIANQLGQKVGTIYVTITRAHKALASCIERQLATGAADE